MRVVDANLLVALVSGDPKGNKVLQYFTDWLNHNIEIHAPLLAKHEIANALTRLIVGGAFPKDKVEDAWNNISILPIKYHDLSNVKRVVEIALALNRQNAYDAAYVALTEELRAELWTLDGPALSQCSRSWFPCEPNIIVAWCRGEAHLTTHSTRPP